MLKSKPLTHYKCVSIEGGQFSLVSRTAGDVHVVRSQMLEAAITRLKSQLCHLLGMWPWAEFLTSLPQFLQFSQL